MQITIVWSMWHDDEAIAASMRAEGLQPVTSVTIDAPEEVMALYDREVLEVVFRDTNLYQGPVWDAVEPVLPANRSHTALSVGDHVAIDGRAYYCDRWGWESVDALPAVPAHP